MIAQTPSSTPPQSQMVARPRATDGIGQALRRAFDDRCGLPPEMARALAVLDRF